MWRVASTLPSCLLKPKIIITGFSSHLHPYPISHLHPETDIKTDVRLRPPSYVSLRLLLPWIRYPPSSALQRSSVRLRGFSNPRPRRWLKIARGVIRTWILFPLTCAHGQRLTMRPSGSHVLPMSLCGSLHRPCLQYGCPGTDYVVSLS